jgi:hypothetical protein
MRFVYHMIASFIVIAYLIGYPHTMSHIMGYINLTFIFAVTYFVSRGIELMFIHSPKLFPKPTKKRTARRR